MLEAVGAGFLHPDRNLHNRRSCSVEIVQYQTPTPGFDFLSAQGRLKQMINKGNVDIWLRIDYAPGHVFPVEGDESSLKTWISWIQYLATDPTFSQCRGFIIGNEPNLKSEGGFSPKWVTRCVYGYGTDPGDTSNVYQFVKTVNPRMMVLLPPVAPWSPDSWGDLGVDSGDPSYPKAPDRRSGLMYWESYQGALSWRAYNNNYHVPYQDIIHAIHVYSNVDQAARLGNPSYEPDMDLRDPSWLNAHSGSRVLEDMHYQMIWAAGGNPPPILISEWNTYLSGSWPCDNYPPGLLKNLIRRYIMYKPNLLGFASFIDQNYAGSCPYWLKCAMTGYLDNSGCVNDTQKAKLKNWNDDFDNLLTSGW